MKKKKIITILSLVMIISIALQSSNYSNSYADTTACVSCGEDDVSLCPNCDYCSSCDFEFDIPHCFGCDWGRDCREDFEVGWCEECNSCEICCFKSDCDSSYYFDICPVCGEIRKDCVNDRECLCPVSGLPWYSCLGSCCNLYCMDCGGSFADDECYCDEVGGFCPVCGDSWEDCLNNGDCLCPDSGEPWYDCYCDYCWVYCMNCGGNLADDECLCVDDWFCPVCGEFWADCINYGDCLCPDSGEFWYDCYCEFCLLYCTVCGGEYAENECFCYEYEEISIFIVEDGDSGNYFIEVLNNTDSAVSTKGMYLTDDWEDLFKWQMPSFIIRPGESISIRDIENNVTPVLKRAVTNFDVSQAEMVCLTDATGEVLSVW